jgi:DNA processing protein
MTACDACLRRSWLLGRLGGHLEHQRAHIGALLALSDSQLIEAVGGSRREEIGRELARFDADAARGCAERAGIGVVCRCDPLYPVRLRDLDASPAVLHLRGEAERLARMIERDPVAIVGARKGSPYGVDLARSLGRGLAASGITVISGLAQGIDAAAHEGALAATGDEGGSEWPTIAVLPGPADRAYPAGKRRLLDRICERGVALSELPPGGSVWRWTFPARNRIIAALASAIVVVEAGNGSGALLTAGVARGLGRPIGAVPGRVTSPLAAGPNDLIAAGATVVRDAQDVLDLLFGAGERRVTADDRPAVDGPPSRVLTAIAEGVDAPAAFERLGLDADAGLAALAELELSGYVRRGPGGRFIVVP